MKGKIFSGILLCICSIVLIGCAQTGPMLDTLLQPVEIGSTYLSLVRTGALLLLPEDKEKNQEALQDLTDRYDVDMVTPTNELIASAHTFIDAMDALILAMREEQKSLLTRELCQPCEPCFE